MENKYFYIYELENGKIKITPHKYNPKGYYDNKFGYIDAAYRMFEKTNDKSSLFIELYEERLKAEKEKLYENINKILETIDEKNNILLELKNIEKVGE